MGTNPSRFSGVNRPVEQVSWNDCRDFIRVLNRKVPGEGFRLPSEAEWEYACRAGSEAAYCYGNSAGRLGEYGWYNEGSGRQTHPVGMKEANAWGLFDIHGNVWEWCEDWYHESYRGAPTDGSAWESPPGEYRVLRGGSWDYHAEYCRSAYRNWDSPGYSLGSDGFRLARTPM
jgi:formylglycine-generating enzyme required for sulfatase activity